VKGPDLGLSRGQQERAMRIIVRSLSLLGQFGQKLGPYLLLEILLPGGTLFAFLLFLYQRRKLVTSIAE
jgi:hypothetical protein